MPSKISPTFHLHFLLFFSFWSFHLVCILGRGEKWVFPVTNGKKNRVNWFAKLFVIKLLVAELLYKSLCPSVGLSVCLSVCRSVCLSVCRGAISFSERTSRLSPWKFTCAPLRRSSPSDTCLVFNLEKQVSVGDDRRSGAHVNFQGDRREMLPEKLIAPRQTDGQADRQTDRLTDRRTEWFIEKLRF